MFHRPPNNSALIKILGQKSSSIHTDDLVGDFQPSLGIQSTYWDNQKSGGKNLRRFNSITHNNSTPHNWEFDGTNDYLGEAATNYGGASFQINIANAYTVAAWWRYDSSGDNYIFGLGNYASGGTTLKIESSDSELELIVNNTTKGLGVNLVNHKWYYLAYTYDGANNYKVYVNGSFVASLIKSGGTGTLSLNVGKANASGPGDVFTVADSRCGHVHVYTAKLGGSALRRNFLATHKMNSDRVYGRDYTSISG